MVVKRLGDRLRLDHLLAEPSAHRNLHFNVFAALFGADDTPASDATLSLYADAILNAAEDRVHLVGHSAAGFPITLAAERVVLARRISDEQLRQIRSRAATVHASDNLLDYLQRLVAYTRSSAEFAVGLSPRGALALLDCARTWAVMHNREHLVPEDLQMVLPAVAAHRLVPAGDYAGDGMALVELLRREVDVIRP